MAGEPQLRQGSDDADWVRYLQELLIQYGYDPGAADGEYGEQTDAAVREFQENNVDAYGRDLVVDGIVGPKTWSSLTQADEIEGESRPTEGQEGQEGQQGGQAQQGGEGQEDEQSESQPDTGESQQQLSFDEPVNLVMQSTDNTCWAACCAMLLGSSEDDVVSQVGDAGGDGADEPEMNAVASALGLTMPGGQCLGPDGWHEMMSQSGPIMVGIPQHYIVLAGIESDGSADNTDFHVYDPANGEFWADFNAVNNAYEIDADAGANLLVR